VSLNKPDENSPPGPYDLAGRVIGLAMRVHRTLGPGFLEIVYRNALCLELADVTVDFELEHDLTVRYRDRIVGTYRADLIVGSGLLVEIKAVQLVLSAHEVQLVNYLTATSMKTGLLLNFGNVSLQFKRRTRTLRGQTPPDLQP
jgi:GxxExxY protein